MAKRKSRGCKCLSAAQDGLAEHGCQFSTGLAVNFTAGRGEIVGPILQVEWIDKPQRGKRLPSVLCAYCPFCGKKKQ